MALNSSGALGFRNCLFKLGTWNPQLPEGAGGCDCLLVVTKANWDGSGAEPHLTACLFSVSCGEENCLRPVGRGAPAEPVASLCEVATEVAQNSSFWHAQESSEDFLSQIIGVFP